MTRDGLVREEQCSALALEDIGLVLVAFVLLFQVSFFLFMKQKFLRAQSRAIFLFRIMLAKRFKLSELFTLSICKNNPKLQERGFKLLVAVKIILNFALALSLFLQGKPFIAYAFFLVIGSLFVLCLRFSGQWQTEMLVRVNTWQHFCVLWINYSTVDEIWYSRACMIRSFIPILVFGEIDEGFFSLAPFLLYAGQKFGWNSHSVFLTVSVFFVFVIPIILLGVRDWFIARDVAFNANLTTLFLSLVPLFVVLFAFHGETLFDRSPDPNKSGIRNAILLLYLFLYSSCLCFSKTIDSWIMPSVPMGLSTENRSLHVAFLFLSISVLILVSISWFMCILVLGLVFIQFCPADMVRAGALSFHVAVLGILFETGISHHAVAIFTTVRVLLAFDKRKVSSILREIALLDAITVVIFYKAKISVSFLSFIFLSVSVIVSRSRENSAKLLKLENDSQSFLSHALKQKFAATGTALENIIPHCTSPSMQELLQSALMEARKGQSQCHAATLLKNIANGTFRSVLSVQSPNRFLATLGGPEIVWMEPVLADDVFFEMDWNLLGLVLNLWNVKLYVQWSNGWLHFQPQDRQNKMSLRNQQQLVGLLCVLQGEWKSNRLRISPQKVIKLGSDSPLLKNKILPSQLCFAILDDNALVRANIERIVRTRFDANSTSFAWGRNLEECNLFLGAILERRVDVVIFDENLEFEDGFVFGHDLGKKARDMGFKGCAILHSAQLESSFPRSFLAPFDGYIEKSAQQKDVVSGVVNAWQAHLEKVQM